MPKILIADAMDNIASDILQKNNIEFENSTTCTIDNDYFNSYRRDKTDLRQWSFVWI